MKHKIIHPSAAWIKVAFIFLATMSILTGCSTSGPIQEMKQSGPSTTELMRIEPYQGNSSGNNYPHINQPQQSLNRSYRNQYNLQAYTREANNELNILFQHLPNPTFVLFIHPHLSQAGYPVPGYSTAFKLYEKDHYALPGEVPMNY